MKHWPRHKSQPRYQKMLTIPIEEAERVNDNLICVKMNPELIGCDTLENDSHAFIAALELAANLIRNSCISD